MILVFEPGGAMPIWLGTFSDAEASLFADTTGSAMMKVMIKLIIV